MKKDKIINKIASFLRKSAFSLRKSARSAPRNEGFSMGELIVAMSLFMVVIALAAGSFITSIRSQRDIVTSTSINSNVSQTIERIAREVRTGFNFNESTPSVLHFRNIRNERVRYKLNNDGSIGRCIGASSIACPPTADYTPITADKIKVNVLKFEYSSSLDDPLDSKPPRITISIEVEGVKGAVANFQTTVAPRNI